MIYLAENLKKLRKQVGITQEELANALAVSPQAVSRWESETTCPDISLLPTIANFFNVTLDDLLGMDKIKDESDVQAILDEYKSNTSKGLIAENIKLLRTAIKRYPNNFDLQQKLAHELSWEQTTKEQEQKNKEEALTICKRILEKCPDPHIQSSVKTQICYLYSDLGKQEDAVKMAETLPSIWETSTAVLCPLYEGEKQTEHCQNTVAACADMLYWAMYQLADLNYKNKSISTADRIAVMQRCLLLFELIFDKGDYLEFEERIAKIHRYIADMEMLEGKHFSAIEHLEKAAEHAIAYDTLPDHPVHTSYLVKSVTTSVSKNYSLSECKELYDKLRRNRYDPIRNDERFGAILDEIRQYV